MRIVAMIARHSRTRDQSSLGSRLFRTVPLLVLPVLLLAGCALEPSRPPEEQVRIRAQAKWDAMIAGDWEKAYSFSTPAYRQSVDLYKFRKSSDGLIQRKAAEVIEVKCDELESCKVRIRLRFSLLDNLSHDLSTDVKETWVADSGSWWRYAEF